jgi:hypothetical protein
LGTASGNRIFPLAVGVTEPPVEIFGKLGAEMFGKLGLIAQVCPIACKDFLST